jgi:hypothetical protein
MNFNDHTVTWDTWSVHYSNERQRYRYTTLPSVEALIDVNMSVNESQTQRDEYSQDTKILDPENKPVNLDDVIKTCENLHVEEQHQLQILPQKYEHLFDITLGEFNIDPLPISLQLMDYNDETVHARVNTVTRSVEHQLQHSKEIVRFLQG